MVSFFFVVFFSITDVKLNFSFKREETRPRSGRSNEISLYLRCLECVVLLKRFSSGTKGNSVVFLLDIKPIDNNCTINANLILN